MEETKAKKLREILSGSIRAKKATKKRKWKWTDEHYFRLLDELAWDVAGGFADADIDGTIILIKPGIRRGRHVMLTKLIGYRVPTSKRLFRGVKEVLENDDSWQTWDIFERRSG